MEVAGLLIERGADVTARNKDGETPLHLVSTRRTRPHWQEDSDMSTGSEEDSDDMSTGSQEDADDMSTGSQEDLDDMSTGSLEDLYKIGSLEDSDGMSSPQQCAELARMLLEHGADVTVRDKNGRTPFDIASSDQGHAEVAHVLLQHGAVPSTHENMD
ncbi:hypothetical protein DFH94DRAFT_771396 [Russula ochroleuca]|uniref:Uncharacterized protein n=1 Tax=Russula ochroleuca TaxID=152965 RepID=A0A9P5JZ82_9AGAM|nr:hypothetical protein DFH94DRAFT_771396 [Russula ochroleuca]